jgi:hypothetical protein
LRAGGKEKEPLPERRVCLSAKCNPRGEEAAGASTPERQARFWRPLHALKLNPQNYPLRCRRRGGFLQQTGSTRSKLRSGSWNYPAACAAATGGWRGGQMERGLATRGGGGRWRPGSACTAALQRCGEGWARGVRRGRASGQVLLDIWVRGKSPTPFPRGSRQGKGPLGRGAFCRRGLSAALPSVG